MERSQYAQLEALVAHFLPGQEVNEDTMAQAIFLDKRHWANQEIVTANAIAKALKGK
ncbi:MAG: DUF6890 family protein [Cellvibrionaceae bacterium]